MLGSQVSEDSGRSERMYLEGAGPGASWTKGRSRSPRWGPWADGTRLPGEPDKMQSPRPLLEPLRQTLHRHETPGGPTSVTRPQAVLLLSRLRKHCVRRLQLNWATTKTSDEQTCGEKRLGPWGAASVAECSPNPSLWRLSCASVGLTGVSKDRAALVCKESTTSSQPC